MSQASPSNPSRAWVFGDKIDTDVLAPGALMKLSPDALARHCLEAVRPAFAKEVRPGDLVIGGASFGIGSSREQAAQSLRLLGVKAVIAKSFARIFYRNAFNLGLPALICPQADEIKDGDLVNLDLQTGALDNITTGARLNVSPIPEHMAKIIDAGGLMDFLESQMPGSDSAVAIGSKQGTRDDG
jgi:3-isopropylmalate/(R)-2-methylmalate dehydratase small subunit